MNKKTQTVLLAVALSNMFVFAEKAHQKDSKDHSTSHGKTAEDYAQGIITKHDKNGDGQLTLEEFSSTGSDKKTDTGIFSNSFDGFDGLDELNSDKNFQKIDTSHDGLISKEELKAHFEAMKKEAQKKKKDHEQRDHEQHHRR